MRAHFEALRCSNVRGKGKGEVDRSARISQEGNHGRGTSRPAPTSDLALFGTVKRHLARYENYTNISFEETRLSMERTPGLSRTAIRLNFRTRASARILRGMHCSVEVQDALFSDGGAILKKTSQSCLAFCQCFPLSRSFVDRRRPLSENPDGVLRQQSNRLKRQD